MFLKIIILNLSIGVLHFHKKNGDFEVNPKFGRFLKRPEIALFLFISRSFLAKADR